MNQTRQSHGDTAGREAEPQPADMARGSRRLLLASAAGALVAGGLLAPALRQDVAAGLKGIRVTVNPNGRGPYEIEGWVRNEKSHCHGSRCRSKWEWNRDWGLHPIGPDQQETFENGAQDLALLFYPGGGAEPFILAFNNPHFGRPGATVGNGSISHPDGPKYLTKYLDDKGLSEGESVTAWNNFFRIERRNDDERKDRKVFVVTLGA